MGSLETSQEKEQQKSSGSSQNKNLEKKISLKAILKEEEPRKLTGLVDKIESGREKIDEYVSRITGLSTKIITTTRNWHRVIKGIILEEGKELLDEVLEELEQELRIAEVLKKEKSRQKQKVAKEVNTDQNMFTKDIVHEEAQAAKPVEAVVKKEEFLNSSFVKKDDDNSEEKSSSNSLISQEVEEIRRKIANKNKTAIEILLNGNSEKGKSPSQVFDIDTDTNIDIKNEIIQNRILLQVQEKEIMKIEDLAINQKDEILADTEEAPLGTSQLEINDMKEYCRKQIEHALETLKEPRGNTLEASEWAPNENTCEEKGNYKAKIAAVTIPGSSGEERIKFVKGTLYRSNHISRIEESFSNGNLWIFISFDCRKGLDILKEKLQKKEIEWYRVIFDEAELPSVITNKESFKKTEKGAAMLKNNTAVHKGNNQREDTVRKGSAEKIETFTQTSYKGKNKDSMWITIWDLPLEYSKQEIRRLLKCYGNVEEIKVQRLNYQQVAEVRIIIQYEEQEKKLRSNWAIGLEDGKLARLAVGMRNVECLKEREGYRAILMNIPSSAQETLLLRALQRTGAKSVYIPYNSNRNPSRIAKVFFRTKEEMEKAKRMNIYYYNTKLHWKDSGSFEGKEYIRRSRSSTIRSLSNKRRESRKKEEEDFKYTSEYRDEENTNRKQKFDKKERHIGDSAQWETIVERIMSRLENLERTNQELQERHMGLSVPQRS